MEGSIVGRTRYEADLKCKTVHVVPRSHWRSADPRAREKLLCPVGTVIIHHTALRHCVQPEECVAELLHIQKMHIEKRGFDDIGYNFLIGGDGTVYEGRGWGVVGAHTVRHNAESVGIALLGNFNNEHPSNAALASVQNLLGLGILQGHLKPNFLLRGHKDLASTECPGKHLHSSLQQLWTQ